MSIRLLKLEKQMLRKTGDTISRYKMTQGSASELCVAYSGGKDSIATVLLLSKLGYSVLPIAVDTDDPSFNRDELLSISDAIGIEPLIVAASDGDILDFLNATQQEEVRWRQGYLQELPDSSNKTCTHCYFNKMMLLYAVASRNGGGPIVLGQHRDDMIDSFLKCYWIDIYYENITKPLGRPYSGAAMIDLMERHERIDMTRLRALVESGRAATDDPFVETDSLPGGVGICRPLGSIPEADIVEYMELKQIKPAGNLCRFKTAWSPEGRAFRLIVHEDFDRRRQMAPGLEAEILKLLLLGIDDSGTWVRRPRNTREEDYPGFKPFIKKL